eukprot:FR736251.1.p1 GENE.FR736251.1~~FR736251.1.p1  ORF type:complete len:124 (+),score=11.63 FR736251.1:62-433(+)
MVACFPNLTDFRSFPGEPFEKIPWFICAFSSGALLTLVPVMESEWFGVENIGLVHGTTMLGAILGQFLLYNFLGEILFFKELMFVTSVVCMGCVALAYKHHVHALSEKSAPTALEGEPLLESG